ncbi:MAG: hypothetical protein U0V64_10185 [Cyclobacteriaceae bacterium]
MIICVKADLVHDYRMRQRSKIQARPSYLTYLTTLGADDRLSGNPFRLRARIRPGASHSGRQRQHQCQGNRDQKGQPADEHHG